MSRRNRNKYKQKTKGNFIPANSAATITHIDKDAGIITATAQPATTPLKDEKSKEYQYKIGDIVEVIKNYYGDCLLFWAGAVPEPEARAGYTSKVLGITVKSVLFSSQPYVMLENGHDIPINYIKLISSPETIRVERETAFQGSCNLPYDSDIDNIEDYRFI